MVEIIEVKREDLEDMTRILVPVFSDKVLTFLGEEKKALKRENLRYLF